MSGHSRLLREEKKGRLWDASRAAFNRGLTGDGNREQIGSTEADAGEDDDESKGIRENS